LSQHCGEGWIPGTITAVQLPQEKRPMPVLIISAVLILARVTR